MTPDEQAPQPRSKALGVVAVVIAVACWAVAFSLLFAGSWWPILGVLAAVLAVVFTYGAGYELDVWE